MTEESSNPQGQSELPAPVIPVARPVGLARPLMLPGAGVPVPGPMYLPGTTARAVWQDLGLFLVGILLSTGLLVLLADLIQGLDEELDERVLTVVLLPAQAVSWVAVVAFVLKLRGQRLRSIGWVRGQLRFDVPLGVLAAVSALGAYVLCVGLIMVTWPAGAAQLADNPEAITEMLPAMHPASLLGLQLIVGFYEELVFRGFLLTRLRRVLGSWWVAVLITTLLFAVLHLFDQRPVVAIPLFAVGVAFCLFTIWRKSVVPAIIGHALFNSWQILWLYFYYPDWT